MIGEDEVGLKEKPEDTRYIKKITSKIRPKAPGVRAKDLIPTLPLLELQTRGKCRCVKPEGTQRGCEISRPGCAYNQVFNCYHLVMVPRVGDGDPYFPVHPKTVTRSHSPVEYPDRLYRYQCITVTHSSSS